MTRIRLLALSLVLLTAPVQAQAGDLTTRDIVELSRSGLGDDVLIALVDVDGGPFDLSPADLLDLKAEGLSDRVLAALVRAGRHRQPGEVLSTDEPGIPSYTDTYFSVDEPVTHHWTSAGERHVIHTVAVPVPVHVPVYKRRRGSHRDDRPSRRHEPAVSTPGIRHGPVTADSIRHAPRGFHPGSIRPRTTTDSEVSTQRSSRPPATPGIARSTRGDKPPTPGVARSQTSSDR